MQTNFTADQLSDPATARANEILRSCVHCGFCNATCPTYQITADELDGPRGRIYLMRDLLQQGDDADRVIRHLDRCLTCRACETTCPSGVAYGELAEIARDKLGAQRPGISGLMRKGLRWMIPYPGRLRFMARVGRLFKWFVPSALKKNLPQHIGQALAASDRHERQILVLQGCAQQVSTAGTNEHLYKLLDTHGVGVTVADAEVCCGSLDLHLGDMERALNFVRKNVDALHPLLASVEAIVSTASGCGVTVKDYGRLLADDAQYAEQAAEGSLKTMDVSEYLATLEVQFARARSEQRIAWQAPCTLQHGQQLSGGVEHLLQQAGYTLTSVNDPHLCCGSAGTYSILQAAMSNALKTRKLKALYADDPQLIATANVGCQTHLASDSRIPVVHWIELLK